MNKAMKLTAAYFDAKGFHYDMDEQNSVITTGLGGLTNKGNMRVYLLFDENERTVGIRSLDYVPFPAEKLSKMYEMCSKMNDAYRWAKFYVEEGKNTITVADDAVVNLDSCGEELLELIHRMCSIGDEVYPEFMKAIWS